MPVAQGRPLVFRDVGIEDIAADGAVFLAPLGDSLNLGQAVEAAGGVLWSFVGPHQPGFCDWHKVRVHAEPGVGDQVESFRPGAAKFPQPFP